MNYLLYILFFLLSLGQIQRISFFDQQINIYLHEISMCIFIVGGIREIRRIRESRMIGKSIIIFLGILFLTLVYGFWNFNLFQNFVGLSYWLRLVLYIAFFGVLMKWGGWGIEGDKRDKGNKEKIKVGINIFIWLTIFFSFLQYFLYPNLRNLFYLGWDPHQYRIFGTYFDTTISGIILVLIFFYTIWEFWAVREIKKIRKISEIRKIEILKIASLFTLILLTYSRITYLSFIFAAVYYFYRKIKFSKIIAFILFFLVLLLILPRPSGESVKLERIFTIEARAVDIKQGFDLFKRYPIFGVGYNRIRFFKDTKVDSHAASSFSSSYITLLVSAGLIGLIGGIWVVRRLWELGDRIGRTLIIVTGIASLFDNVFLNNFVLLVFGVFFIYFTLSDSRQLAL